MNFASMPNGFSESSIIGSNPVLDEKVPSNRYTFRTALLACCFLAIKMNARVMDLLIEDWWLRWMATACGGVMDGFALR